MKLRAASAVHQLQRHTSSNCTENRRRRARNRRAQVSFTRSYSSLLYIWRQTKLHLCMEIRFRGLWFPAFPSSPPQAIFNPCRHCDPPHTWPKIQLLRHTAQVVQLLHTVIAFSLLGAQTTKNETSNEANTTTDLWWRP